jgi:hypothetical protein
MVAGVVFALELLPAAVTARVEIWAALGIVWRVRLVDPNHGKPAIVSEFECHAWLGTVTIWSTGEAELETVRLTDDRMVNKHYDLTGSADLDVLMADLVVLLVEDRVPSSAVVARRPEYPVR